MPWSTSDRRSRLPADWPQIVARIKKRDQNRCKKRLPVTGKRCPRRGTDVDHIIPGDDHRDENLQLLCEEHHREKSAQEGHQARWGRQKITLRTERQPGRLR